MTWQAGSLPVPDYKLVRRLGAGAFGEVWQALGPGDVEVALKFIRLDPHVRSLELRSLEVMKRIRHPNLVSLFGAWHKKDWLILAMELCDCSLQDRLAESLGQGLPGIPLEELLRYMSDAASGLDALNARQVQHRDVKPANLLLLDSGVKVADFGLAKALEQTVGSNSGAGTVAYTPPEGFRGALTQQSDQYSLAVTYYHLRTGQLLFRGDQAQVMYAHLELHPDLSRLPQAEGAILGRALSKEPEKRWRSCNAFVNELIQAYQTDEAERIRQTQEREKRQEEAAARNRQEAARKKAQENPRRELGGNKDGPQPIAKSASEKAGDSRLKVGGCDVQCKPEAVPQRNNHPISVPLAEFNWLKASLICFSVALVAIILIFAERNRSESSEGAQKSGSRQPWVDLGPSLRAKEQEAQRKAYQEKSLAERLLLAAVAWIVFGSMLLVLAYVWYKEKS